MATLNKATASIELAPAKTAGLADLGIPTDDTTLVKKGRLQEFLQRLDDGTIARRFQNIRVTAVKATEGGRLFTKLFVQFEVFADDWVSLDDNTGFQVTVCAGDVAQHNVAQDRLFLPYCRSWYENQYERTIPSEYFDALTRVEFVANADTVEPA